MEVNAKHANGEVYACIGIGDEYKFSSSILHVYAELTVGIVTVLGEMTLVPRRTGDDTGSSSFWSTTISSSLEGSWSSVICRMNIFLLHVIAYLTNSKFTRTML